MENKFTKEEIRLIQESFTMLKAHSARTGQIFYENLFKKDPEISKLFKGDIKEQAGALMRMVKTVVEGLNNPQIIIPAVQELGRRHNEYGVKPEQYKVFGECLINTIESVLNKDFSSKAKEAWQKLYNELADVMKH